MRPTINKIPERLRYGNTFEIETNEASGIESIALIRPSVTTHCVNVDQRYIGLEFNQINSNILKVSIPTNRNIILPGYYMLFIVSENKIPSVARFVTVN
jgi:hypothetical protein